MRSTSTSDPDLIVSVENLHIVFDEVIYRSTTVREAVTRWVRDPIGSALDTHDKLHVLRGLNFEVRRGCRLGLLGLNGTGKSTLCRCIAGIYGPSRGKVKVQGQVQAVFDTAMGVIPELTGRENAMLLAQFLFPDCPEKHKDMVEEALDFAELRKFADVAFKFYSNGMQARLYLSLISSRPVDLMILDEVFDGADSFFREKVSARVQSLLESSGAVIFVSHAFDQLRRVCNRLIVLDQGVIAFDGDVEKGIHFYQNARLKNEL